MTRILNLILLAFISSVMASVLSPTVRAQASTPLLEQDLRLARIADAMLVSNARLCRETMPVPGIVLHSADQYGEEAEPLFANGPVAIAQVIPGSAADRAGLEAGDAVLAINGTWIDTLVPEGDGNVREAAFFLLADVASEDSVSLELQRAHERTTVVVDAPRGCRSLVEILVAEGPNARSDGRVIQLQFDFARTLSDEQVAVLLAHELAHTVLEHRRRKVEAGIDNASLFRHLGRNQRVNRQAEVEADTEPASSPGTSRRSAAASRCR